MVVLNILFQNKDIEFYNKCLTDILTAKFGRYNNPNCQKKYKEAQLEYLKESKLKPHLSEIGKQVKIDENLVKAYLLVHDYKSKGQYINKCSKLLNLS